MQKLGVSLLDIFVTLATLKLIGSISCDWWVVSSPLLVAIVSVVLERLGITPEK